jgi:hypothetical protein
VERDSGNVKSMQQADVDMNWELVENPHPIKAKAE